MRRPTPTVQTLISFGCYAVLLSVLAVGDVSSADLPSIQISAASVAPEGEVKLEFALVSAGVEIVTIAPMEVSYDPSVLSFETCGSRALGKSAFAAVTAPGMLRIVVSGGMESLGDGLFLECSFRVRDDVLVGESSVALIRAEASDRGFREVPVSGSSCVVSVLAQ